MIINSISFKGTFCVNRKSLSGNGIRKLAEKKDKYEIDIYNGGYRDCDSVFIHTPDKNNSKVIKLLSKLKIPFSQVDERNAVNKSNILSRLVMTSDAQNENCSVEMVDTEVLDRELRKDMRLYIGKNGKNGIDKRYQDFINFLKTNQQIEVPTIYLEQNENGEIETNVYDGRHRIAVLRDMGFDKIPVAMNKKSKTFAEQIGLI